MREKRKCPFCGKEMICVNAQDGEFTCTTCAEYANHDVLDFIEKLQDENERLKGEVDFLSMRRDNFCDAMEELVENGAVDTFDWTGGLVILAKDTNYEFLRNENAKLKCLVLHAMFKWAAAMACFFSYKIDDCDKKEVKRNISKMNRYDKKADQYCKAYRKAKAKLRDGL